MPRRARVIRRVIPPDAKYQSENLAKFINRIMQRGKKSTAERIVYKTMDLLETQTHRNPLDTFDQALRNVTPVVEVKPRRVGGATYQVPVDIRAERRGALAMRWLIQAADARRGKSMAEKLAAELMDAAAGQGATVKKKEDTHRMAEANRAFVHYRW
jgi:small subunit ribosomal protein S7